MEKYIEALKEHCYNKKQRDEIFKKIASCDISPLPHDCHSCKYKYVGVEGKWCTYAGLDFDTASISRGERLPYCPLEIKMLLDLPDITEH